MLDYICLFGRVDFKSSKHFHGPLKYRGPVPLVSVDMWVLLVEAGICEKATLTTSVLPDAKCVATSVNFAS